MINTDCKWLIEVDATEKHLYATITIQFNAFDIYYFFLFNR
jgi:hypothetical protein